MLPALIHNPLPGRNPREASSAGRLDYTQARVLTSNSPHFPRGHIIFPSDAGVGSTLSGTFCKPSGPRPYSEGCSRVSPSLWRTRWVNQVSPNNGAISCPVFWCLLLFVCFFYYSWIHLFFCIFPSYPFTWFSVSLSGSFSVFNLIFPLLALSISGQYFCEARGITSDVLLDWVCVAMDCCIFWKALHTTSSSAI